MSGLHALPIRPVNTAPLSLFQNKTMRGFLMLSQSSPVPALYFLLGELPVEGLIHINTLSLFHNIWSNPDLTVNSMVAYILKMCKGNSTTWSNHVQLICQKYGIPSPLALLLSGPACSKSSLNTLVKTRVTVWHEEDLRRKAASNSKMQYLNVELCGLSGRPLFLVSSLPL